MLYLNYNNIILLILFKIDNLDLLLPVNFINIKTIGK
jgi:hypothetical protein